MKLLSSQTDPDYQRFSAKFVIDDDGCWTWNGRTTKNGYGRFYIGISRDDQRYASAHRWSYEALIGPIPDGLDLDHLCRNRACVNPTHLEPVTRRENIVRGVGPAILGEINGTKTHCVNNHELKDGNVRLRPSGGRTCRQCERDRKASRTPEQLDRDRRVDRDRTARTRAAGDHAAYMREYRKRRHQADEIRLVAD